MAELQDSKQANVTLLIDQTFLVSADLFHGSAGFKPRDWELRVTPVFDLNYLATRENGVVNTPLRFPDEFARHKILDIFGDFYLLGRPLRGFVTARMTGHSDNVALLKLLRERFELQ